MSLLQSARTAWQALLPEKARRVFQPALALALNGWVRRQAYAPHAAEALGGPIRVVGYFGQSHGIAASARLAVRAFQALGVPVEAVDVSDAQLNWTGTGQDRPPGPWIFHLNPPELLAAMAHLGATGLSGPRYGYWAWELPRAPASWLKDGRLVDEIWAPSSYTAAALAHAQAPVRVVPHPLFLEDYTGTVAAHRTAAFLAVSLFDFNSSLARKNPMGAISAFAEAFGPDPTARLILKTQNGHLHPDHLAKLKATAPANVEILDVAWSYGEVKSLIAAADVLISLHRAEGFGLTPAEAMALGTPVIATGWSGNLDFMDEGSALLIASKPIAVEDAQGIYRGQSWADPDVAAAAQALRRLRQDPALGHTLAAAARKKIGQHLSPQAWFTTLPHSLQRTALAATRA